MDQGYEGKQSGTKQLMPAFTLGLNEQSKENKWTIGKGINKSI